MHRRIVLKGAAALATAFVAIPSNNFGRCARIEAAAGAKGRSIHIGLNNVDPGNYFGWNETLRSSERDAEAMKAIAGKRGFQPSETLLADRATALNVLDAIDKAAQDLRSGDILLLTYSGHGSRVPDSDGTFVSTWVLWDRELIGHELYARWARFQPGVRICVVSDSCHSGTVVLVPMGNDPSQSRVASASSAPQLVDISSGNAPAKVKMMPADVATKVYIGKRQLYDAILRASEISAILVSSTVVLISACQDDQETYDGAVNSVFTTGLLHVWDDGRFSGSYRDFRDAITKEIGRAKQQPNHFTVGAPNPQFVGQGPFAI